MEEVRIDKWLWAVRIFKTRTVASEACKKGHVSVGGLPVKPSRMVQPGETVKVRIMQIVRSYKVLALSENRMSARLAEGFVQDITPPEELEILEMNKNMRWISRERGTGRPTKKERRDLDEFFDF